MKICFIVDTIFKHGGVERVLTTIVNELSNTYDVDIICTNVKEDKKENVYNLDLNKVNIIYKGIDRSLIDKAFKNIFNLFKYKKKNKVYKYLLERSTIPTRGQREFIELINNNKYDVVIGIHGFYSLFLATIDEYINAKTIGWQHSSYDAYFKDENKHYGKKKILFHKYFNKLDYNILLTNEDKVKYEESICNNNCVIYNPLSFISEKKSELKEKKVIAVGRLAKSKGFDLLIKAYSEFIKENKDWELIILGDGKERDSLTELINKFGLGDNVRILGFTNNVKEYYIQSSIFVSPSRWEGFGLSIVEAMEYGLPVIAFNNSGPREIIENNKNGILVDCNNTDMLANELKKLADDEKMRQELAKNSIIRAEDFSINSIIKKWTYIIES